MKSRTMWQQFWCRHAIKLEGFYEGYRSWPRQNSSFPPALFVARQFFLDHAHGVKLNGSDFDIYVPDGRSLESLSDTTHLAIGAHQDDLELMAFHGISECYDKPKRGFTGVVVTSGSSSPRSGQFAKTSDREMIAI